MFKTNDVVSYRVLRVSCHFVFETMGKVFAVPKLSQFFSKNITARNFVSTVRPLTNSQLTTGIGYITNQLERI